MHTSTKLFPAVIGTAGVALAAVAMAGAPATAVPTCQLSVDSNKVLNLQDRNGDDEIFFKLGNSRTQVRQYVLNQKRFNLGSETFQGTIDLKVFERDGNNVTRVGTINNIPCSNNPGELTDLSGAGAIYRVAWSVA
jgi:hypothetical protein